MFKKLTISLLLIILVLTLVLTFSFAHYSDTLLSELYETNKRNRETQLNPHFIYNVLDSIS